LGFHSPTRYIELMNLLLASPIVLMVVGIGSLIVFTIVWAIKQERKRKEAMRVFAESNGFSFVETADGPGEVGLPEIELFGRGHSKRMTNIMAGEVGGSQVRVLDYRYTTGSGKNSSTSNQTIVAITTGDAGLPDFTLAREHFFHKIGQVFGYQDIDFDRFPEFSKKYLLRGANEGAIRAVFTRRLIDAYINKLDCNVEARDGWLFVHQQGKRIKPELIQPKIESTFEVLFELIGA
jgi:hypothetical protein